MPEPASVSLPAGEPDAAPPRARPVAGGRLDGRLRIGFTRAPDGRTFPSEQHATYPYHVCRPFRFEGDPDGMATFYLQSASGGLYEGERLAIELVAQPGAAAHVTTQASTVVHEMRAGRAEQSVLMEVADGALMEFVSDPLILFPGARVDSVVRLVAAPEARAIVVDAFLAHDPRPGDGPPRPFGRMTSDIRIETPGGRLLARDRLSIAGEAFAEAMTQGPRRFAAHANVVMVAPGEEAEAAIERVRALPDADPEACPDLYLGVSRLPGGAGAWVRIVAADGAALRRATVATWSAMREAVTGRTPARRRK